jgi:hypothetical protein
MTRATSMSTVAYSAELVPVVGSVRLALFTTLFCSKKRFN